MTIQPLNDRVPITNPDGTPTQFFLRQLQERGITTDGKITAEQAEALIEEWSANRDVNVTAPITGGGPLSSDVTIGHQTSPVTPGSYTNTNLTVDAFGHITAASNGSGGGGGGGWTLIDSWTYSTDVPSIEFTSLSGYDEVLLFGDAVSASVSGRRAVRFSNDNGSNYAATGYSYYSSAGVPGSASPFDTLAALHETNSGSARTFGGRIILAPCPVRPVVGLNVSSQFVFSGFSDRIDAIQLFNHAGGNLTGGSVYLMGLSN